MGWQDIDTTSLLNTAAQLFNALWPIFSIMIGLILGLGLVSFVAREVSAAVYGSAQIDYSEPRKAKPKARSHRPTGIEYMHCVWTPLDDADDADEPGAQVQQIDDLTGLEEWRLGDDGEIQVIRRRAS